MLTGSVEMQCFFFQVHLIHPGQLKLWVQERVARAAQAISTLEREEAKLSGTL